MLRNTICSILNLVVCIMPSGQLSRGIRKIQYNRIENISAAMTVIGQKNILPRGSD